MVVFGLSGRIRANWLFSGKSGCIRANMVVYEQSGCMQTKCFHSGKIYSIWAKLLYSSK